MKKILYLLLLIIPFSVQLKAQETPPAGLRAVNGQFYINLVDSAIWQNKGTPYGWQRLARYKDITGLSSIYWKLTGGNTPSGTQALSSGDITTANGKFGTQNVSTGRIGYVSGTKLYDSGTPGNFIDVYNAGADVSIKSDDAIVLSSYLSGIQRDLTFTGSRITSHRGDTVIFSSDGGYIKNQASSPQTANFYINGSAIAGGFVSTTDFSSGNYAIYGQNFLELKQADGGDFKILSSLSGTTVTSSGNVTYNTKLISSFTPVDTTDVVRLKDLTTGYVPTTRTISTGYGISGGGDLSADRTFIADSTALVSKPNLASQMALKLAKTDTTAMLASVMHLAKVETATGLKTFQPTLTGGAAAQDYGIKIQPIGSQTSTALFTGLYYNQTGTFGSGTQRLFEFRSNGTGGAVLDANGNFSQAGRLNVGSTGTLASSLAIAFSTMSTTISYGTTRGLGIDVASATYTSSGTSGTVTNTGTSILHIPTFASQTNAITLTNAATLTIEGVPVAGSNTTITNAYPLDVLAGQVNFRAGTKTSAVTLTTLASGTAGTDSLLVKNPTTNLVGKIAASYYVGPDAVNTATDANYTITSANQFVKLPTITASRTVSIPTASSYTGRIIRIWNQNATAFNWSFTGATVKDAANNTLTNLVSSSVYILESDGTNWLKQN